MEIILDRLRAAAFQAAAQVYPWRIALHIASLDDTQSYIVSDELKPSVIAREGTHTSLVSVLSPLF